LKGGDGDAQHSERRRSVPQVQHATALRFMRTMLRNGQIW
jgi:hypothetical protein